MSYDITKLPCGCYEDLGKYYPVCVKGEQLYQKTLDCLNGKHTRGIPYQIVRKLYNEHFCDIGNKTCSLFEVK